ncbi:MAG: hypothetical protein NTU41_10885 [Chloroflexi bacterium]|nr:hypothetical protein [Chloroflexota bacterium]
MAGSICSKSKRAAAALAMVGLVAAALWPGARPVSAASPQTCLAAAKSPGDNTGDTLNNLNTDNDSGTGWSTSSVNTGDAVYTVIKNKRMYIDTWDVSSIPVSATITGAVLHVQCGATSGYNGTNQVRYDNGAGLTNTGIVPKVAGWSADLTYDLYSHGVNTRSEIQNVDIEFYNSTTSGTRVVNFDYVWIVVTYNSAPAVNSVTLTNVSMTPQQQYAVTVNVANDEGKTDLTTLVLKVWYDTDANPPTVGDHDGQSADTQKCAVITWTRTTDTFAISPSSSTTWSLGSCTSPGSLPGDFTFRFTVGKVAAEASGAAKWQITAKVTDSLSQTAFNYDATPPTMNWYGEVVVNTASINWGTVALGSGFTDDTTNRVTGISVTYVCNSNYSMQVKASSPWTGSGASIALSASASPGDGQFALKADHDATLAGAVLVLSTAYVTFDTGTRTGEAGNTATGNSLWLKLGASGIPAVQYSGIIYYAITQ